MIDLKPFVVAGLALGSVYALSGLGLVVLYRATGVLNFAYGAVGAVGAMLAWQLREIGWATGPAFAVAMAAAVALSILYGVAVAPSVAARDATVRATSTLGFALALLGLMLLAWSDDPRATSLPTDTSGFEVAGVYVTVTQVVCLAVAIVITAAVSLFLRRARLGIAARSLAGDRELTAMLGVPVRRVEAAAWAASGALAGFTGILLADLVATDPNTLTFMVIPALAAATIGRFRSLSLTLAGGLAVGTLQALATPYSSITQYRNVVPFLAAILVLLVLQRTRPTLVGRAA